MLVSDLCRPLGKVGGKEGKIVIPGAHHHYRVCSSESSLRRWTGSVTPLGVNDAGSGLELLF